MATLIITSCATNNPPAQPFNSELYCTKEAKNLIKENTPKDVVALGAKTEASMVSNGRAVIMSAQSMLNKCYGRYKEVEKSPASYRVCTVIKVNDQGKLEKLEIDDATNPLEPDLKKCLVSAFEAQNYSDLKSTLVVQPFNFK